MKYPAVVVLAATVLMCGLRVSAEPSQPAPRRNIGAGFEQTVLRPGTVFEPRVEVVAQYVDNIDLASSGEPQVDMAGLSLEPGFFLSHSSDSAVAAVDYTAVGRLWEESDYNDMTHRLAANGQWIAVPEWFGIRAQASYSDSVIDPRKSLDYGGLGIFGPGNLTEVATAAIGPVLQHRFDDLEIVAEYEYGRVWYIDDESVVGFDSNQDSIDQNARVSLGTFDRNSRVSATVFYDWQESEFEEALPYAYEQAGLEAGYRLARTLSVVGDFGRESDLDASTTEGGLDAEFWSAGLRWDPSDRSSAEARIGERFFGHSYLFNVWHRARLLEFDASYTEEPTIETRLRSLGEFEPGELPTGVPDVGVGRFNSTPFVNRESRVGITAAGSRTTVNVASFQQERDYIRNLLPDETTIGVQVAATRQLASNLSAGLSVGYTDFESRATLREPLVPVTETNYDTEVSLLINRTLGSHLTLGGEAGYLNRSGGDDYEGWWVALRLLWTP